MKKIQFTSEKEGTKSAGYSTDVDQLARSKRLLALENRWKNTIKKRLVKDQELDGLLEHSTRDNYKQYGDIMFQVNKALVFIDDLDAGILRLGDIVHPNARDSVVDLCTFIDNLFTYGSGCLTRTACFRV